MQFTRTFGGPHCATTRLRCGSEIGRRAAQRSIAADRATVVPIEDLSDACGIRIIRDTEAGLPPIKLTVANLDRAIAAALGDTAEPDCACCWAVETIERMTGRSHDGDGGDAILTPCGWVVVSDDHMAEGSPLQRATAGSLLQIRDQARHGSSSGLGSR